jgi:hypothetical protein
MCSKPDNRCPTFGARLRSPQRWDRANLFIRKDWGSPRVLETRLHVSSGQGESMPGISRRLFIGSSAAFAAPRAKNETVYHFATSEYDVRMTVEFHDRYSSNGFGFRERLKNREFCLSGTGEEGRNCLANFSGSLAIARYHIRPRSKPPNLLILREQVRTIDQDHRLNERPPFERVLEIQGDVASDIQAFGYETDASSPAQAEAAPSVDPWCFLRQDLYFDTQSAPFLVVHWKHTLSAIRLLDVIPGDQTRPVENQL